MSDRVWMLPIEPLAKRYTCQWTSWWRGGFERAGWEVVEIHHNDLVSDAVGTGQFLDAYNTHIYKAWQTQEMARALRHGLVHDGDWVFLHDGWTPTLTALGYMRSVGGVKFKLAAYLHAGTWDAWDHLSLKGMGEWARGVERTWLELLDVVLLGTRFHADLICSAFGEKYRSKMRVVGLPMNLYDMLKPYDPRVAWTHRSRVVVFPHRLAPEKQPQEFDHLRRAYMAAYPGDEVQWLTTADKVTDLPGLYRLLGSARVAFSAALQETFGIVMQEAAMLGCWPVVPDRLSYQELFEPEHRYRSIDQAVTMVRSCLDSQTEYDGDVERWHYVIPKVSSILKAWPGWP